MTTLAATEENIRVAAQRLADGLLVAMPTETVYGLGADALNEAAAKRIFEVKGRPPTDPLIVHITNPALMDALWDVDAQTRRVADVIAAALWPGPITLVAKASAAVPTAVTGGSGFVGLRSPNHPVARQLIDASGKCIAAPSANTFGHVSPTTAAHVAADLASRDPSLTILDGGNAGVGIESTVVKFAAADHIEILRRGAVSAAHIMSALEAAGMQGSVSVTIRDTRAKYASEHAAMDGPGQLLTHYSPTVASFLVSPSDALAELGGAGWALELPDGTRVPSADVLVLNFSNDLDALVGGVALDANGASSNGSASSARSSQCLASRSLSTSGVAEEACHEVFDALRWTETVAGAKAVIFPLVTEFHKALNADSAALLDAVEDRLFRAASGKLAQLVPAAAAKAAS